MGWRPQIWPPESATTQCGPGAAGRPSPRVPSQNHVVTDPVEETVSVRRMQFPEESKMQNSSTGRWPSMRICPHVASKGMHVWGAMRRSLGPAGSCAVRPFVRPGVGPQIDGAQAPGSGWNRSQLVPSINRSNGSKRSRADHNVSTMCHSMPDHWASETRRSPCNEGNSVGRTMPPTCRCGHRAHATGCPAGTAH